MRTTYDYDAVVVGSGPNGLAAAITLARGGCSVLLLEGSPDIGGGLRSAELTLPGFVHDVCSAIHPLGLGSPFFRSLPLSAHGLRWLHPDTPLAHPLDNGRVALLHRSLPETAEGFGQDAIAYERLMNPLVRNWDKLLETFLAPLALPRHPLPAARFALSALLPASFLASRRFKDAPTRALFAGLAAHSIQRLDRPPTAAFALVLGLLAHAVGWPVAAGGSRSIAAALASYLKSLGGEIETGRWVRSLDEIPPARAVLLDVAPRQLLELAGDRLPALYRRQLEAYRYGPGSFKVDLALDGPIPWSNPACSTGGTVHVGGSAEEIADAERAVWKGEHPQRPFVLLAQQSVCDPARAPEGKHTVWAYCHVPNGSDLDMTERILAQIERFAPGFRDRILARHTMSARDYEQYNPNYVGGDINTGVQNLLQLFTRPAIRLDPYRLPIPGLFLCSSATPPGGGVHGMCGVFAARSALKTL